MNDTMAPTAIAASKSDNPKDRTESYCKELGTNCDDNERMYSRLSQERLFSS